MHCKRLITDEEQLSTYGVIGEESGTKAKRNPSHSGVSFLLNPRPFWWLLSRLPHSPPARFLSPLTALKLLNAPLFPPPFADEADAAAVEAGGSLAVAGDDGSGLAEDDAHVVVLAEADRGQAAAAAVRRRRRAVEEAAVDDAGGPAAVLRRRPVAVPAAALTRR